MKSVRLFILMLALPVLFVLSQCRTAGKIPIQELSPSTQESPVITRNDQKFITFLDDYLDRSAIKHNFSGVVLYARDDSILFNRAYGLADRSDKILNTVDTKLNLASASKMFTAVAVAKLVEEGRLSYIDPIGKYIDTAWVSKEVGAKVQIKHLLNHTSGLGHYWDEYDKYKDTIQSLNDYRILISDELAFEPGSDYRYSNSGYILLGVIVEKVTAETYYKYVQETIFAPCGMHDTGFYRMDEPYQNLATGYFEDEEQGGKLVDNKLLHGIRGSSAGGGWSTATDLLSFIHALKSDKLISAEMRSVLWTPKPMTPHYGYGFQIKDHWVGHWGGFPGIEAFVFYFPNSDRTFLVLSNYYDSALPLIGKMDRWYRKLNR